MPPGFFWFVLFFTLLGLYFDVSQVVLVVKYPLASAGDLRDTGSIPGSGRCPGVRKGNPLQYSCWENPRDKGVWWAT